MNDQERDYLDAQEAQQMRATAQQTGMRVAAEQKERTVHNEGFLNELRRDGLDSEAFEWLHEEYPHWFADARSVTNRGDSWDRVADLIMENERERAVAEGRPGRLLRDRPFLLASMRGDESPPLDAYLQPDIPGGEDYWHDQIARKQTSPPPITSEEQSRIYGAAEIGADLMTQSRNAAGIEAVSTVKTDHSIRREKDEEGTASRIGRVLE